MRHAMVLVAVLVSGCLDFTTPVSKYGQCAIDGESCDSATPCCTGLSCSGGRCSTASKKEIGEPCASSSECVTNTCNGSWCDTSTSCSGDPACGQYAWCLKNSGGQYRCFPNCNTNSDCLIYGSGYACQTFTSRSGATARACSQ